MRDDRHQLGERPHHARGDDAPNDGEVRQDGDGSRWRVTWEAPDYGPRVPVHCPECRGFMGTIASRGRCRLLCRSCGSCYLIKGNGAHQPEVRLEKRVALFEDLAQKRGLPTLGEAIRGEIRRRPRGRALLIGQFLMALLLSGILLGALVLMLWLRAR